MLIRTTCLISLLALALPACQSDLSHTRLSAQDASVNADKVNSASMHQLEAAVLTAVRERHPASGMANFYLLKGSNYDSYEKVAQRLDLSTGLVVPEHTVGTVPPYAVRAVNLHDTEGSVVAVHPGGTSEVAVAYRTVPGKGGAKEWQVVDVKNASDSAGPTKAGSPTAGPNKVAPPAAAPNQMNSSKWYRRYADDADGASNTPSKETSKATPADCWFNHNIVIGSHWENNDSPERQAKRAARADMIAKHRVAQANAKRQAQKADQAAN